MDQQLIAPRHIGEIEVGPIALGTMRFADRGTSKEELANMFSFLYHEIGVNVHHSSYEYSSYSLYCDALALSKKKVASLQSIYVSYLLRTSKRRIFQKNHLEIKYTRN